MAVYRRRRGSHASQAECSRRVASGLLWSEGNLVGREREATGGRGLAADGHAERMIATGGKRHGGDRRGGIGAAGGVLIEGAADRCAIDLEGGDAAVGVGLVSELDR